MRWRRFRNLLLARETPHRTALAFAIGVCLGISPLLGLHTILGLAIAYVFRLNRVVTLTGVYVTNPWTIIPIYAFCTWTGVLMLDSDLTVTTVDWHAIRLNTLIEELGELFMPFVVGTTVVSIIVALLSYFAVKRVLEKTKETEPPLDAETGE